MDDLNELEEYEVMCGGCGEAFNSADYRTHNCIEKQTTPVTADGVTPILDFQATSSNNEDSVISKLAEAVQARPPLWDHTLPLKLRAKDLKEKLWREVYDEINRSIPLEQLEKKWRNLRDTFLKHYRMYTPSGSGADEKKKWKHFDLLFFLAEKNEKKRTISNMETSMEIETELVSPGSSACSPIELTPSSSKRQKKKDEADQLLINILKEPQPSSVPAPSPALLTIQSILEKLPARIRMEAEIDMINKVYGLYAKHGVDK